MRFATRVLHWRVWQNDSTWALFLSIVLFAAAMLFLTILFRR